MPANPDHSADEPTEEMLEAGFAACKFWIGDDKYEQMVRGDLDWPNVEPGLVAAYKAMRAARPEAQAAPKLTEGQIRELIERSKDDRAIIVGSEVRQLAYMALASLHAGVSGDAAAEGVMVPLEPTPEMLEAYYDLIPIAPGTETWAMARLPCAGKVYRAFLEAAPAVTEPGHE